MTAPFAPYEDRLSRMWESAHLLADEVAVLVPRGRMGEFTSGEVALIDALRERHRYWQNELRLCESETPDALEALHTARQRLDIVRVDLDELSYWTTP